MKDLSGKYLKCGELYIKFGDDGTPDYGFQVAGTQILRFFNMKNNYESKEIMLPPIKIKDFENKFLNEEDFYTLYRHYSFAARYSSFIQHKKYLDGYVTLAEDCFCDLRDKIIVVSTDYPIRFQKDTFLNCKGISFALTKNQTIFNIHECYNGNFDYEHYDWKIIADKGLPTNHFNVGSSDFTITKNSEIKILPLSTDIKGL